jgi:thioesterase domain-containing protein/acyl carrier protein
MGATNQPTDGAALSGSARALADLRLSGGVPDRRFRIPRLQRADAPLSFAQERLWFLDRLRPGSAAYNMPLALRLSGPLDRLALETAVNETIRRHESLRTTFRQTADGARQLVSAFSPVPLDPIDLSHLGHRAAAEALRLVRAAGETPFDLTRGPLFRAGLVRLGPDDHVLLLTLHHIIADGWSMGVLATDVGSAYVAAAAGASALLPSLPIQYCDYAIWERERQASDHLRLQLDYWRQRLDGLPEVRLPAARSTADPGTAGAGIESTIRPEPFGMRLDELARAHASTPFVVFLSAFAIVLARYLRQTDFVIGSPVANRPTPETEGLVGLFVNTVVLRMDLSGDPSAGEIMKRAREATWGALAHASVPFEQVVRAAAPHRTATDMPLVQALFGLEISPMTPARVAGVAIQPFEVEPVTRRFDLELAAAERGGGWALSLLYSTELLDAPNARQFLAFYHSVLETIVQRPDTRLSEVPELSLGEDRTPSGEMAAVARRAAPERRAAGESETTIERQLVAMWQQLLGRQAIGVSDDFFALGGHSLLSLRLMQEVQTTYGLEISLMRFFEEPTVAALARQLCELQQGTFDPASASAHLVALQPAGAGPPIFCVHPLGGGVSCFTDLAAHLEPGHRVYGLQAGPLHDPLGETAAYGSLEAMAAAYLSAVPLPDASGSYALCGWSFGGVVAFEMARQLHAFGRAVPLLALLDSRPPLPAYVKALDDTSVLVAFAMHAAGAHAPTLHLDVRDLTTRDLDTQIALVFEALQRIEAIPPGMTRNDVRTFAAGCRSRLDLLRWYTPREYKGRIVLFRAAEPDPSLSIGRNETPTYDWELLATGGVDVVVVPGPHEALPFEPAVRVIADELRSRLAVYPGG